MTSETVSETGSTDVCNLDAYRPRSLHMTSANDPSGSGSERRPEDAVSGDVWPELRVLATRVHEAGGPSTVQVLTKTYAEEHVEMWRSWLSMEERRCLQSFGSEKRRREFTLGRAAARQLVGQHLDLAPSEVPLVVADDGAVDVVGRDLHLSIAHSGPHAVATLAPHPVGVDLEAVVERDHSLIRFLLHPDERDRVMRLFPYDTAPTIVLLWTLKESVLKARRSGFRLSPKKLRIDLEEVEGSLQAPPATGRVTVQVDGGIAWHVGYSCVYGRESAPASKTEESPAYWSTIAVPASAKPVSDG